MMIHSPRCLLRKIDMIIPEPSPVTLAFGVREPLPLRNFPPGRVRLRMRNRELMQAFVKTSDGIMEFIVKEQDGFWEPFAERNRNRRLISRCDALPPLPPLVTRR